MQIDIHTSVFNSVYLPHLGNVSRIQIFYGGSSSGKSVFLAQRAIYDLMEGHRNYLVCRQVARTVRSSVFQEMQNVISRWGVGKYFKVNKADAVITCLSNNKQAIFVGMDDVEKLKSITPMDGAITDIWVEEATETNENSIKQLMKRQRGGKKDTPKRITLSFNPILQDHWIFKRYFAPLGWRDDQTEHKTDRLSIQKTWYIHNKFLTADDVYDLEHEEDKYFRDVYTFGNWGVLGNVIFTNWEVRNLDDMKNQFTVHRNGLDFGYSADPAALWVAHYDKKKKTIYIYDEFYERGLTNDILATFIKDKIENRRVVCDSAEPKSIAELRRYNINAYGAKKGKDSVLHGIQWLQQHKIIVDAGCINLQNELRQYKWKEDKFGEPVSPPQPVDINNHLIDAGRYAHEEDMLEYTVETKENPFFG